MIKIIRMIRWILAGQMGLNFRKIFQVLRGLPLYANHALKFRASYRGTIEWMPCLTDRYEEGGTARGEYFWQDLYVARKIFQANPERHIDIGSRVDGFVAHVASFREIEIFDIRPIAARVPGVVFKQADLMQLDDGLVACCDSLSCLHALEHFGLGRYGDALDVNGLEAGLRNMARLLSAGGTFYLSLPIGRARVQFNAHRISDPVALVQLANANNLSLENFAFVKNDDQLIESSQLEHDLRYLSNADYALGIFTFRKG